MDKAKSASISLPESYWGKLKKIADDEFDGNRTAAIKKMIDKHTPLDRDHPIGDLIRKHAPLLQDDYQRTIAKTRDGLDPEESNYLLLFLQQCFKMLHDPDRSDMALMTVGEVEKALRDVTFSQDELTLQQIQDIAYRNINDAKKRKHLGSAYHVPGYNEHEALAAEDPAHYNKAIKKTKPHTDFPKKPNGDVPRAE